MEKSHPDCYRVAKANDQLHLIHYESDRLCSWKPGPSQLQESCTSYTYITNEIASYKGHFGPSEHDYSHWLALNLPHGRIALRILLFIRPEAASKAKRDATPLRLISWLNYKLNPELELFIEKAMEHLSTWKESEGAMGQKAIQQGEAINTEMELRDRLIDRRLLANGTSKPAPAPPVGDATHRLAPAPSVYVPHLWGTLDPDWTSGLWWFRLETPIDTAPNQWCGSLD